MVAIARLLLLGWFFWSTPIEMLTPNWPVPRPPGALPSPLAPPPVATTIITQETRALRPERHGGFGTLRACERAAVTLEQITRWRLISGPCLPDS